MSYYQWAPQSVAVVYTPFQNMTHTTALGMLRVGNTGNEILQILDVIVEDITQENINDCAAHYAAISADFEF